MIKTRQRQRRSDFTYTFLQSAAHESITRLGSKESNPENACLVAMLLAALTMEAFLNHIGPSLAACWDYIERFMSPREKLRLVLDACDYRPDRGRRPYQTFSEMFEFRTLIVHGRTVRSKEIVYGKEEIKLGGFPEAPRSKLTELITVGKAKQFVEDMEFMITDLWENTKPHFKDIVFPPGVRYSHEIYPDVY